MSVSTWLTLANLALGMLATVGMAFVPVLVQPRGRLAVIVTGLALGAAIPLILRRREPHSAAVVYLPVAVGLVGCLAYFAVDDVVAAVLLGTFGMISLAAASVVSLRLAGALVGVALVALPAVIGLRFGAGLVGLFLWICTTVLTLMPTLVVVRFRRELEETLEQVRSVAATDPLTGLANRRGLAQRVPHLLALAAREGKHVVVLAADLDHFKRINDRFGHNAGDEVLRDVAAVATGVVRAGDLVARTGGEELCVVAILDRPEDGADLAERLRKAVERDGSRRPVTVSVGAVLLRPSELGDAGAELVWGALDRADGLLYEAKAAGRNTVRVLVA